MTVFAISTLASGALLIVNVAKTGSKHGEVFIAWKSPRFKIMLLKVVLWALIGVYFCFSDRNWKPSFFLFIPILISETLVLVLALVKGYQTLREQSHSLIHVLVKDSIFYFLGYVCSVTLMTKLVLMNIIQELHLLSLSLTRLDTSFCAYSLTQCCADNDDI